MNIYLDMDDVVADFTGYAKHVLQDNWVAGERLPMPQWLALSNNPHLYRDLAVKDGAVSLVSWCMCYAKFNNANVYFLSALPRNNDMPWAAYDKIMWAKHNFPEIPVFIGPYSKDKAQYAQPGDILIDDRASNCNEWELAGGVCHQYTTWEVCSLWLMNTLSIT